MLSKGAIQNVLPCQAQYLSYQFLVQKKDGGKPTCNKPINLNQNIEYQHFKMEGFNLLKENLVLRQFPNYGSYQRGYQYVPEMSNLSSPKPWLCDKL